MSASRDLSTPDLQPRPSVTGYHGRLSVPVKKRSSGIQSSATWTSNSGDLMSDTDEIANRDDFVDEYNRLAKKHGVRQLVPDQQENAESGEIAPRRNWWSRTFRRSSSQSTEHSVKRKRSVGHVTAHMIHPKRDSLKDQDLQELVRLCGKSFLYLPPEYAPGSLILPTCFRATAQYLIHLAPETRGVFRIPGSVRVVNELYEYYCAHQAGGEVANTVRSPNLPSHINAGIHDVASLFKKFLAGLPGGILGSLSLFDALVAINSQLYTDPEFSRTKQGKLRARLIALAVGTLRSQYRRELICAVFGLLCLLGRAAETAPREDESGRPLPTSDLMGYSALGIVFGPLLIGDMLGSHAVKLADPSSGLFLVPVSPPQKSKKEKKKTKESTNEHPQAFWDVDKIHVANDITEMLITNWRDVVKQMRNLDGSLGILRHRSRASISEDSRRARSLPRNSEDASTHQQPIDLRMSEDRPLSPTASSSRAVSFKQTDRTGEALSVKKTRLNPGRSASNLARCSNFGVLSPPREESFGEIQDVPTPKPTTPLKSSLRSSSKNVRDIRKDSGPTRDENVSPGSKGSNPTVQSSHNAYEPTNLTESTTPTKGVVPFKRTIHLPDESRSTHEAQADTPRRGDPKETLSRIPKATNQDDLNGPPGKNLKPTFSCDLDSMTAYAVVPGAKILSGTSTMHFQPKTSHTDSATELANVESSSRSVKSKNENEGGRAEKVVPGPTHIVTPDQMDGAADIVMAGNSCRGLFRDLKNHFEGREPATSRPSSYPISKDWSKCHAPQHNDVQVRGQKPPLMTPRKVSPLSAISCRDDLKRGASKVLDLAAKFDNAARVTPLRTTMEDVTRKNQREAVGLVSPYTSNPSPLQSVTSVSTPTSLTHYSRDKLLLPATTVDSVRKSRIPRPQNPDSSGKTERSAVPTSAQDEASLPVKTVRSHPVKSRLLTPSCTLAKKEVSDTGPSSFTQLDGSSNIPRLPLTLTAQHEIRPDIYYSSPILGNSGVPRLSQHSMTSIYGEVPSNSQDVSSPSLSPSPSRGLGRGRSASSLRDQIRSLRQELSSKNEEYAQLQLEFEENRKSSQVSEILLREDLDRAKADLSKWKRRAERAESKAERYERMATRAQDIREPNGGHSHDFSFVSGLPDDIDIVERTPQHQPLSARMNQSARRAPENVRPMGTYALMGSDAMSDCSGSTVVRNTIEVEHGHWTSADGLVETAAHGSVDDLL
ncbi:hypothetical protein diail_12234 [Diaporthe ilicicola]|nr:hypothetical protein diail_12234 [Diaporthe ilicicola]